MLQTRCGTGHFRCTDAAAKPEQVMFISTNDSGHSKLRTERSPTVQLCCRIGTTKPSSSSTFNVATKLGALDEDVPSFELTWMRNTSDANTGAPFAEPLNELWNRELSNVITAIDNDEPFPTAPIAMLIVASFSTIGAEKELLYTDETLPTVAFITATDINGDITIDATVLAAPCEARSSKTSVKFVSRLTYAA
jgi:hypothetical protein